MRKGKYHRYKLDLLNHLINSNFLIKIGEDIELLQLAGRLGIPTSSWYDITRDLEGSRFIIMRRKNRVISGNVFYGVYEIQLTKEGLEHLTRFSHA